MEPNKMRNLSKLIVGSIVIVASISAYLFNTHNPSSGKEADSRLLVQRQNKETDETWEPFNNTNSHNNWCPYATCYNSPVCSPCNRRFLLIIATGRSGSTTLLSMMNKLPGVRLSGENWDEIGLEKQAVDNLYQGLFQPKKNRIGAWTHNKIPAGAFSCATQKMFEIINPPSFMDMKSKSFDDSRTIIGFKTIRFQTEDNIEDSIQFVKESFPCARIIVNIRSNIEEQTASHKNTINSDLTVDEISRGIQIENGRMSSIANMFGEERARLIDMSKWTKDESGLQVLNDVVHWLGFRNCTFNSLYHENLNGFGHADTTKSILDPNCNYPSS